MRQFFQEGCFRFPKPHQFDLVIRGAGVHGGQLEIVVR